VTAFDRLHPALQHHIVNTLGWTALRPLQELAIAPIVEGGNALLLGPTAGGKTEAAAFPVLSRMLSESWTGLSVLYLCPLRALLNNLQPRLTHYARLVGREVAMWHGDVGDSERRRILGDAPDLLLTTPESLELMLISRRVEHETLFRNVRSVVIDEVHAFAADDRGWHLLSVLERIERLAARSIQRVGLSATIGNPDDVLGWLMASRGGPREVVRAPAETSAPAEVGIDFVGGIENAAIVISRLHRGEKRLVFCDSRARVEEIATNLRKLEVQTFVSHSSLSPDERRQAENAFSSGSDCVIVATSTLELGIDVGDLDRVVQIDAPIQVASFLQRLGRTGRRAGTVRNCLFLATEDDALVRAAALCELWAGGYVEQVRPPDYPIHLFAQQVLALSLQQNGIGAADWAGWIGGMPGFSRLDRQDVSDVLRFMVERGIVFDDEGVWSIGREGERAFGRRHFMDLLSAFTTEPLFTVKHGELELGRVHHATFAVRDDRPPVLLLSGRPWVVTHVDWESRVAFVEPSRDEGKSRWIGLGQPLQFELCQSIARVLAADDVPSYFSRRTAERLATIRGEHPWVDPGATTLVTRRDGRQQWYTFCGLNANSALAEGLRHQGGAVGRVDNLSIEFNEPIDVEHITRLRGLGAQALDSPVSDRALEGLKFVECLPERVARKALAARLTDRSATEWALASRLAVTREST
jgi:ATP-dependent Lhr-like helicase